jgi:hypothetical protein
MSTDKLILTIATQLSITAALPNIEQRYKRYRDRRDIRDIRDIEI